MKFTFFQVQHEKGVCDAVDLPKINESALRFHNVRGKQVIYCTEHKKALTQVLFQPQEKQVILQLGHPFDLRRESILICDDRSMACSVIKSGNFQEDKNRRIKDFFELFKEPEKAPEQTVAPVEPENIPKIEEDTESQKLPGFFNKWNEYIRGMLNSTKKYYSRENYQIQFHIPRKLVPKGGQFKGVSWKKGYWNLSLPHKNHLGKINGYNEVECARLYDLLLIGAFFTIDLDNGWLNFPEDYHRYRQMITDNYPEYTEGNTSLPKQEAKIVSLPSPEDLQQLQKDKDLREQQYQQRIEKKEKQDEKPFGTPINIPSDVLSQIQRPIEMVRLGKNTIYTVNYPNIGFFQVNDLHHSVISQRILKEGGVPAVYTHNWEVFYIQISVKMYRLLVKAIQPDNFLGFALNIHQMNPEFVTLKYGFIKLANILDWIQHTFFDEAISCMASNLLLQIQELERRLAESHK